MGFSLERIIVLTPGVVEDPFVLLDRRVDKLSEYESSLPSLPLNPALSLLKPPIFQDLVQFH
jgi:hypothetical protein